MRRLTLALLLLTVVAGCLSPASASAKVTVAPPPDVAVAMFPVQSLTAVPRGFTIDPARAIVIAESSPKVQAIHRAHHPLQVIPMVWVHSHYEVRFYFHGTVLADQLVGPNGQLGQMYTGALVGALFARGHYGDIFDSPWVLVPFTLMFLLPIVLLRGRRWLDRLDLAVVLVFGVSYALFDTVHLEPGVWAFYPPLVYLLVRMLIRGARPRGPGERLECRLPMIVLVLGLAGLIVGRIIVDLHPWGVLDVGTASVIGAYRILHGQSIYYVSLGHGDTYGPLTYLIYAPFEAIWPGNWFYLPAARAATITFDMLTIAGLIVLGSRLRRGRAGWRLGLVLGWLWAACPFTLLGMEKNTNDGLVALIAVLIMLALNGPIKRGVLVGVGAAAKFFPAILLPLVAVGRGDADQQTVRKVLAAFVIVVGATVAVFMPAGGLKEMWDHTLGFQLSRPDVFSIWALHPTLAPIKVALEAFAVMLAVIVAFRPRGRRTLAQVAALAGALTIAVELPAVHWSYLYIPWFLPFVLIAVLGAEAPVPPAADVHAESAEREADTVTPVLAGAE